MFVIFFFTIGIHDDICRKKWNERKTVCELRIEFLCGFFFNKSQNNLKMRNDKYHWPVCEVELSDAFNRRYTDKAYPKYQKLLLSLKCEWFSLLLRRFPSYMELFSHSSNHSFVSVYDMLKWSKSIDKNIIILYFIFSRCAFSVLQKVKATLFFRGIIFGLEKKCRPDLNGIRSVQTSNGET